MEIIKVMVSDRLTYKRREGREMLIFEIIWRLSTNIELDRTTVVEKATQGMSPEAA